MRHLVLVGAGARHVEVVHALARAPLPSARVTWLVPPGPQLQTSRLPAWVAGRCEEREVARSLKGLADAASVDLLEARIAKLDPVARELTLEDGSFAGFDTLSLDAEPAIDRDAIPGLRAHALFVRPMGAFVGLWSAVVELATQRPLDVVVIGAGAQAAELALAVAHRLGGQTRVAWVTGGGAPWPEASPAAQARLRQVLRERLVTVFEETVAEVSATQVRLEAGMRLACDAPLVVGPTVPPAWLRDSGLALDDAGRVVTMASLQSRSHHQVFAIGELAGFDGRERLRIPKGTEPALAANLRRHLAGGGIEPVHLTRPGWTLLDTSDGAAIAAWRQFAWHGRLAAWWGARSRARQPNPREGDFPA